MFLPTNKFRKNVSDAGSHPPKLFLYLSGIPREKRHPPTDAGSRMTFYIFRYRGHCPPTPNFQISSSICFVKQTFAKIIGLDLNPQDFPSEFSTIGTHLLKHYRENKWYFTWLNLKWCFHNSTTSILHNVFFCLLYQKRNPKVIFLCFCEEARLYWTAAGFCWFSGFCLVAGERSHEKSTSIIINHH